MSENNEIDTPSKLYPFVARGEPDPGGWCDRATAEEPELKGRTWKGQLGWRRRHGPAVTRWLVGDVKGAENALLLDGSHGKVSHVLDHGFRRLGRGDPLWIYGDLELSDNDVRFVDGQQPTPYQLEPSEGPSLEADLLADQVFRDRIRDNEFAYSANALLLNMNFYKGDDPRAWSCSFRHAARLVAGLRDLGESYQDYYMRQKASGLYPDDELEWEAEYVGRVKRLETEKQVDIFEVLASRLPTTFHLTGKPVFVKTREELVPIAEEWKRRLEEAGPKKKPREERLAEAREKLEAFRNSKSDPIMAEIKAHLTRLGWRRETADDVRREKSTSLAARVVLLDEIESFEQQDERETPEWAEKLRNPLRGLSVVHSSQLQDLSSRERGAFSPDRLKSRLLRLARSGRLTEDEYRNFLRRLAKCSAR